MYTKKVVEKSFEHTKMEKLRLKKAICRGVVDSLNGVLNIFEHFEEIEWLEGIKKTVKHELGLIGVTD